jgi:hypothetical protein
MGADGEGEDRAGRGQGEPGRGSDGYPSLRGPRILARARSLTRQAEVTTGWIARECRYRGAVSGDRGDGAGGDAVRPGPGSGAAPGRLMHANRAAWPVVPRACPVMPPLAAGRGHAAAVVMPGHLLPRWVIPAWSRSSRYDL